MKTMFCWDSSWRKQQKKVFARAQCDNWSVEVAHIDGTYRKKSCPTSLFTNLSQLFTTHSVSISLSLLLFPRVSETGISWFLLIHWIRVNSGSPGRGCFLQLVLSSSLLHGFFFLVWQKGEEEVQREGVSCRVPRTVWLQLSLAISEWTSRWQAWSALLALLGRGELYYLEQGNNPCVILTFWKRSVSMLQICRELLSASSKCDDQDTLFECSEMADAADATLLSYRKRRGFLVGEETSFKTQFTRMWNGQHFNPTLCYHCGDFSYTLHWRSKSFPSI